MRKPRIGILGGMGPAATILLQQRVLAAVPATTDADHVPLLIDMNPQVPSRIDFLIHKKGPNPGPVLARMARDMAAQEVDALAMPCCTAHHFADDISEAVSVPFLNMVDLTADSIAQQLPRGSHVGVLASPANQHTRLFETALEKHELIALHPDNSGQVLATIEVIKASGLGPSAIAEVQTAAEALIQDGAGCILIGCSEFSLLSRCISVSVPVVDALDELTNAIVGMLDQADVRTQ